MKNFIILLFLATFYLFSCTYSYQTCEFQTKDTQLRLYNDVLTELIERHFYSKYLGEEAEIFFNGLSNNDWDSTEITQQLAKMQNQLFNDSARFCTIYLDTLFYPSLESWAYYEKNDEKIKNIIIRFSDNPQMVIDSLNTKQNQFSPKDFHLCIAHVKAITNRNPLNRKCEIGSISFSKVFLDNTQQKGLLFYEFHCGANCGKAELLVIEKKGNRWFIVENHLFSLS